MPAVLVLAATVEPPPCLGSGSRHCVLGWPTAAYRRLMPLIHNRASSPQGATRGWAAVRDWAAPGGGVDLAFLRARFGAALVSATDTARQARASMGLTGRRTPH